VTDEHRRRTLRDIWRWIVTSWKAAVAVAGGLAVILGLVFHPPWAGSSSSGASDEQVPTTQSCPGISNGDISDVTADESLSLDAYWKLNPGSRAPVSKERLNTMGRVVHFRVDVNGYRGKQLTVWWWMLTSEGAPVSQPELQRQLAFGLTPHDCTTGGTRDIWVELPKRRGRYKVVVQLLDPAGEKLDDGRTKPFTVPAT
jgi:hypothetical protein